MIYTNEEIARAAGYKSMMQFPLGIASDWATDPASCAQWLLPVLEKREPNVVFDRDDENKDDGPWIVSIARLDHLLYAPTWHGALIEAIMATAEGVQ